jgi:tetratricopeptide (TPR) repeat protein
LLQAAAVLGQTFTLPALAAAAGVVAEGLESRLVDLVRREILVRDVDPRSPERGQYGFVQAAIREVAYSTLSRRDRRARHLAAARYFEAIGDDELAGVLASHYVSAWKADPEGPEAAAIVVQARLALRGAAERAAALHDYLGAARYLENAIGLTEPGHDRATMDEQRGDLLRLALRYDESRAALQRAIATFDELGDQRAAAHASTILGRALIESWRPAEAIPMLEAALARLDLEAPDPTLAAVVASLARAHMGAGNTEKGLGWADRAIAIAERSDSPAPLVDALITRAWAAGNQGRNREALALLMGAAELGRRYGLPQEELRAIFNQTAGAEEDPQYLEPLFERGLAIARRYGLSGWLKNLESNWLWFLLNDGQWDRARQLDEERAEEMGDDPGRHQAIAFITAARGEFDEAEARLAIVEAAMEGVTKANDLATVHISRGMIRLAQGRLEEAVEAGLASTVSPEAGAFGAEGAAIAAYLLGDSARLETVRAAFETTSPPPSFGKALRAEIDGMAASLAGDLATARARFQTAIETHRTLRVPISVAVAELLLVSAVGTTDPAGQSAADEARTIFEGLRAQAYLAMLDRVLEREPAPPVGGSALASPSEAAAAVSPPR